MTLKEISDRELRKWCVEKSLDFFNCNGSGQQITTVAEHFFQYIKFGPDDECDCCGEPDDYGPVNTGLGMGVIREVADIRSGAEYIPKRNKAPVWFKEKADLASPIAVPYPDNGFHMS